MKILLKSILLLALLLVSVFSLSNSVNAQTASVTNVVVCPVGYTCIPVACPEGYTCIPIENQPAGCPDGYFCNKTNSGRVNDNIRVDCPLSFNTNLRIGSEGNEVSRLQAFLISKGYDTVVARVFGSKTKAALIQYQIDNGIPATGFFGPLTRSIVNRECGNNGANNQPNRPVVGDLSTIINTITSSTKDQSVLTVIDSAGKEVSLDTFSFPGLVDGTYKVKLFTPEMGNGNRSQVVYADLNVSSSRYKIYNLKYSDFGRIDVENMNFEITLTIDGKYVKSVIDYPDGSGNGQEVFYAEFTKNGVTVYPNAIVGSGAYLPSPAGNYVMNVYSKRQGSSDLVKYPDVLNIRVNSDHKSIDISETGEYLQPTVSINPTVSVTSHNIELSYDGSNVAGNGESQLTSSINFTIQNNRDSDIYVYDKSARPVTYHKDGVAQTSPNPTEVLSMISKLEYKTLNFGVTAYLIPAGYSAKFNLVSKVNPKQMFAGQYQSVFNGIAVSSQLGIGLQYINPAASPFNRSNIKAIFGEISPYISLVNANPIGPTDSILKISGTRFFGKKGDTQVLVDDVVSETVRFQSSFSIDSANIFFKKLTPGQHTLQLRTSEGDSNKIEFSVAGTPTLSSSVEFVVPKGGEKLVSGEKYLLKWNTIGFKPSDTVQIEIWDSRRNCPVGDPGCLRGGDILVSNITNTGSYIWNANLSKMAGYYGSTTEPVYRFRITVGQVPSTEQSKVGSAWSQPFSIIPAKQTQTTQAIPFLSSISPSSARYGDTVTLYGSNLSNIVTNQLSIRNSSGGEINPSIISKTSTSITFKLPNIPYETYDVMVFDANDSNSLKLTVLSPTQTGVGAPSTSPSSSSYIAPAPTYTTPYITKTSPTIVKAGDTVTLEGVNFEGVDSSLVFIRNNTGGEINPEVTSISNTKITFKVPNISYGTYSVSLLGDKGDSNTVTITIGSTSGASAISVWGWLEKMFK